MGHLTHDHRELERRQHPPYEHSGYASNELCLLHGTDTCPTTGFDKVMPEGRSKPWKFVPRRGETVGISLPDRPLDRRRLIDPLLHGSEQWTRGTTLKAPYPDESPDLKRARMSVADVLRTELDQLQLKDGKGR